MDFPMDYKTQSFMDYFNQQPAQVKGVWNADTEYNKRYLWYQIYSCYNFDLPESITQSWFRYWLFQFGSIAVIYTKEYGWIAYPYSIEKLDLYYQPKQILVTSPFLKDSKTGIIGKNCEIVKILDDYYSLSDLVTRYATQLSSIDKAVSVALMNTNVAFVFGAEDKKQADTIKEAYAKATQGNPLVTVNKNTIGDGIQPFFPSVKNNFIVNDLLQAKRTVVNEFLTKIGINNANYDKKERLNTDEVNQNNDEIKSIISVIYDNISRSFDRLNTISNGELRLKVSYAYNYDKGGDDIAAANTMGNLPV